MMDVSVAKTYYPTSAQIRRKRFARLLVHFGIGALVTG